MADVELHIGLSHIIAIVVAIAGPSAASLVAWGRLTANVKSMKEIQQTLVSSDELRAAVAEMKTEIYKALGERRDPNSAHDRRKG
jgi:Mg2+/Co2+ transporter CorB